MLFIVAFISSFLLLPVKERIGNLNDSWPVVYAKETIGLKRFAPEEKTEKEKYCLKNINLDTLPRIPRDKKAEKKEKLVVWAKKTVLIDAESGKVIFEDKMLEGGNIASLTKLVTATVLMDVVKDWNEKVEISPYAASAGGATVHFLSGEKFLAKDLLKAMLMNSDNTAARALAEHFGGPEKEKSFTNLMNKKVEELNLRNSHFVDASGLEDEGAHSCAYDIAMIGRETLKHPMLIEIMQTPSHIEIVSKDEFSKVHRVGNTDILLGKYSGILGAKTGFTYNAGYCLLMMRELPDKGKIIGVVLDAGEDQRWTEMQKMLDWAYDNYEWSVFPE